MSHSKVAVDRIDKVSFLRPRRFDLEPLSTVFQRVDRQLAKLSNKHVDNIY